MFKELDWMTVSSRCNYNKAVLIYKALIKVPSQGGTSILVLHGCSFIYLFVVC